MGNKLQELILIPIRIWILNQKVLVGITLCKILYWKCIRYVSLQHFLRIRKIYSQSAMSIPSFSSHFKKFWIRKWVNVFSKVIYTNLKQNPEYRHVYLNEDLTVTRSTICYHARQLVKRRKAKNVWTTNEKISLKDNTGEIHNISTKDAFLTTARQTDPSFVKPENF